MNRKNIVIIVVTIVVVIVQITLSIMIMDVILSIRKQHPITRNRKILKIKINNFQNLLVTLVFYVELMLIHLVHIVYKNTLLTFIESLLRLKGRMQREILLIMINKMNQNRLLITTT